MLDQEPVASLEAIFLAPHVVPNLPAFFLAKPFWSVIFNADNTKLYFLNKFKKSLQLL